MELCTGLRNQNYNANIMRNIKDIVRLDGIYIGIFLDEFNRLVAVGFIGRRFIIDLNNRQVLYDKAFK